METGSKRWIVVGLGNPGEEYQSTRHNIGVMVVDHLATSYGVRFSRHKSRNDVADVRLPDGSILVLAKPHSYMNTLGSNVRALADFYSVTPEFVIACHDELDIDFATLRLKLGGGENGHNGYVSGSVDLQVAKIQRISFFAASHPPNAINWMSSWSGQVMP
jgi:PTH1 family peptidyl-tRNA hydrolase